MLRGIAIDPSAGKLYWTDRDRDVIGRANLDGSEQATLVSIGLSATHGIALDPAAGFMYWTDTGNRTVKRATLDGDDVTTLVGLGLQNPWRIALDVPPIPEPSAAVLGVVGLALAAIRLAGKVTTRMGA